MSKRRARNTWMVILTRDYYWVGKGRVSLSDQIIASGLQYSDAVRQRDALRSILEVMEGKS